MCCKHALIKLLFKIDEIFLGLFHKIYKTTEYFFIFVEKCNRGIFNDTLFKFDHLSILNSTPPLVPIPLTYQLSRVTITQRQHVINTLQTRRRPSKRWIIKFRHPTLKITLFYRDSWKNRHRLTSAKFITLTRWPARDHQGWSADLSSQKGTSGKRLSELAKNCWFGELYFVFCLWSLNL